MPESMYWQILTVARSRSKAWYLANMHLIETMVVRKDIKIDKRAPTNRVQFYPKWRKMACPRLRIVNCWTPIVGCRTHFLTSCPISLSKSPDCPQLVQMRDICTTMAQTLLVDSEASKQTTITTIHPLGPRQMGRTCTWRARQVYLSSLEIKAKS